MEKIPPRKADSHSASQKIPRLLWNLAVQYRLHKSPPLLPTLSQLYSVHTFPSISRCPGRSKDSNSEAQCITFRNKLPFFLRSSRGPTLIGCPRMLTQYIRSYPSICGGRTLQPQPEDAPCRGNKGPATAILSLFVCTKLEPSSNETSTRQHTAGNE
jgi:hypothetical protein